MTDISASEDEFFLQLQREYLAELPARVEELRADVGRFQAGDPDAAPSLRTRFHRLAGSGGSYGFSEISRIARELEHWIGTDPPAGELPRLEHGIAQLVAAFREAGADIEGPLTATREPAPPAQALVVVSAIALRARVIRLLEGVGYQVRAGTRQDPPSLRNANERVDLLVVAGEAGEGDPSAVASAWTSNPQSRPRAVVLIETLRAVDRLRAVAAGIDMVIPVDNVDPLLPRYATTLARVGAPPAGVLLVEPAVERAEAIAGMLEAANIRVVRCLQPQAVQELLEREVPDLLLVGSQLPEVDPSAIAALVRQDRRFALHPVLFLGNDDPATRIAALQAGADDFLPATASPELLVQAVVTRAERGRRLRELVHRDTLTGLLNNATLLAELEHAVDYERRHGGVLAFVVFDLDRFHEINERHSHYIGDRILLHVANVFRANVRASDIIGRYGGEEFGMVLRGGTPQGAAVLAGKLRRVLAEHPYVTPGGEAIPVEVSVGAACFPGDGVTAADLARAADRSLEQVKAANG
jgi:diguanylate cyclase (GGDEF)-like protein